MLNKKRKDYISDIIRYGTEATINIPSRILTESMIEPDNFKVLRESLATLQADTGLEVTLIEIPEYQETSIHITLAEEETNEEIDNNQ